MAAEPFHIIVAPYQIWRAPVGESFPAIDEVPAGNWDLVGTDGNRDYDEAGITVTHGQNVEQFRFLGSTGPRKASRTEESLMLEFTVYDLSLEHYGAALNMKEPTIVAAGGGNPGTKTLALYQGFEVEVFSLLCRGAGPYGDGWDAQYEIPYAFRDGDLAPVYSKGEPAGLAWQVVVLEDPDAATEAERFGRLIAQHAAASG